MEIAFGIIVFFVLIIAASGIFIVKQQTTAVIERLGKFICIRQSGLNFKIPIIDKISGRVTLKIQQLDVLIETKTKDNVFVKLKVSVQFKVLQDKVYDAFYRLENPHNQITSYIFDVVRAEVPKLRLDDVFEKKDDIAIALKEELGEAMSNYGYDIIKALVTDIDPDAEVKIAMNKINTAEREKLAAEYEGEAEKIRIVARATAEAESKKLQGKGIADQRREIARGLEESVATLNRVGIGSHEASSLIVITQHYDTLHSIGASSNSNLILMPNSPSTASDMMGSLISSFQAAQLVSESMKSKNKKLEEPLKGQKDDELSDY